MGFELFVAGRYLRSKRKGLFAWVTTVIGVAGVAIGVAALVATLSVMNGFQSDIERKVIGAQAHLTIYGPFGEGALRKTEQALAQDPEVVASAPFALGQAIILYKGRSAGIVLKGLDPSREFQVNDLARSLKQGSWEPVKQAGAKTPGIVLGAELAANLGAWIDSEVVLLSPQGAATALGVLPTMKKFKVAGLLRTGYYEYDSSSAYCNLGDAAAFFGLKSAATHLGVRIKDMYRADDLALQWKDRLGVDALSFGAMNKPLFGALRLEKFMMLFLLTLIILVATFTIASNLILMTTEKLRDIGLLKAMGAAPAQIRNVFLWEGLMIGGSGVGLGIPLGLAICEFIRRYQPYKLPAQIYYISEVPVQVRSTDLATIALAGLLLTLLATLYPAWKAAKIEPVEAIHYG